LEIHFKTISDNHAAERLNSARQRLFQSIYLQSIQIRRMTASSITPFDSYLNWKRVS